MGQSFLCYKFYASASDPLLATKRGASEEGGRRVMEMIGKKKVEWREKEGRIETEVWGWKWVGVIMEMEGRVSGSGR